MKSRIALAAIAYQLLLFVSTNTAAATAQHDHPERYYADAVEELEHEIGSGIHGDGASEGGDRKANDRRNHNQHQRRTAAATAASQQNSEEIKGYKKKIDKRKAERERIAREDIQKLNDRLQHTTTDDRDDRSHHNDLRNQFHKRQQDKKMHLDKMHKEVINALEAHHSGRKLLSEEEMEHHTRRKGVLERKKRTMEEETPEKYIERMERHEEKIMEKLERKKKRYEERFRRREEEL